MPATTRLPRSSASSSALEIATRDLERQREKMNEILPEATSQIFDAHLLMMRDDAVAARVRELIQEGTSAEYALRRMVEDYLAAFERIEDPYLQERALDVKDIGQRLLRILLGIDGSPDRTPDDGSVLIARELTLTDLSEIDPKMLRGIALATGGVTSHATILAKSFEIPTVVGIEHLLEVTREGDEIIVDGNAGVVYRSPGPEVIREYERMERDYRAFNERLESLHDLPAVTTDGRRVALSANVGLLGDVVLANRHGAEGVGLYRTEFPFISFRDFPTEQEQLEIYRKVIGALGGKPVTLRTLDLGADKYPAYLHVAREENPFLGWRSIRVSLAMPEFFARPAARRPAGRDRRPDPPAAADDLVARRAAAGEGAARRRDRAISSARASSTRPTSRSASWSRFRPPCTSRRSSPRSATSSRSAPTI